MKILITGAHFTPAVAVIEEFKKKKDIQVVYVGRQTTLEGDNTQSVESKILPALGVKFIPIIAGRFQRTFSPYTFFSLLKIPIGFIQSVFILYSEKPDGILSFGGYVGLPLVIIGWLFSIPVIIHEQTLVSGLANRISALFADRIALSFSQNVLSGKENAVLTGNPVREDILKPEKKLDSEINNIFRTAENKKMPVILITGGNQGSHVLNTAVEGVLNKLTEEVSIIHITGDNKFGDFERLHKLQDDRYLVRKWIDEEWGEILAKVDLVVSRAGINTLTELAMLGKPALVVPLPYLYQDEQNKNAKFFEELGLARVLPQRNLSQENLFHEIEKMLKILPGLKESARRAKSAIIPDGAKRLALEVMLLLKYD